MHRSPGIYLRAEENPGKPDLGDCLMKSVRPVIASNEVPYIQITSIGSHGMSGRDKEGKKERIGWGCRSRSYTPAVHVAMGCDQKNF